MTLTCELTSKMTTKDLLMCILNLVVHNIIALIVYTMFFLLLSKITRLILREGNKARNIILNIIMFLRVVLFVYLVLATFSYALFLIEMRNELAAYSSDGEVDLDYYSKGDDEIDLDDNSRGDSKEK